MCGQAGLAGSITGTEERLFQHLLIVNSIRGLDSTGAGSVKRHEIKGVPQMVVAKEIGNPFELLSIARKGSHDFSDVLSGNQRALLGHCRAKTIGEASRKNAHPFMFDGLMGTHNGTLSYQTQQTLTGKDKYETDSEALFFEIEQYGIAEALKKIRRPGTMSCIDAYALVWYNLKDNTINFLRNQERPLHLCFDKDKKLLFWSSELGHLYAVTNDTVKHDQTYIWSLPVDTHYSWEIPSSGQAFGKARVVKREGGIDPLAQTQTFGTVLRNYKGGTGHTDTTYKPGDYVADAWHDPYTGFWQRFNRPHYQTEWSNWKTGPWFDTKQKAWDDLSEREQEIRIKEGRYPSDIKFSKKLGNTLAPVCKLSDRPEFDTKPLDDSLDGLNGVTQESRAKVTVKEEYQKKVMDKWFQEGNHNMTNLVPIIVDQDVLKDCRVYFNNKTSKYVTFTFKGWSTKPKSEAWVRLEYDTCPKFVPFTNHDIQARHFYKHEGKKKKKVTYFRGFNGDMLVRPTFEKIMEEGCLNCSRTPQWGNYVRFVDHKFFYCEHCERHTELVDMFKPGKQEKRTIN